MFLGALALYATSAGGSLGTQDAAAVFAQIRPIVGLREGAGVGEAALPAGDLPARLAFSLDFRWLYLFHLGKLPVTQALGCAGALVMAAAALLVSAARPLLVAPDGSIDTV